MNPASKHIQNVYLFLTLTNTLAASLIWGINTLFLLDAGLSNAQAFLVNAFFTVGMVIFEIPTGVIADAKGRRASYLLGTITLIFSTMAYFYAWQAQASLILWILSSLLLGFGFTFFSGATEAWLVDALNHTKFKGGLESVFAKGQIANGIAMLTGSITGGVIAQFTNLGAPYIVRVFMLGVNFFIAYFFMKDIGFIPGEKGSAIKDMKNILAASIKHGLKNRPVKWLMFAGPFSAGAGIYAFYAMQPYLLGLYGDGEAYAVAGAAAAVVAGTQIFGGLLVPKIKKLFKNRTSILLAAVIINTLVLTLVGLATSFIVAILLLVIWAFVFAVNMPIRQAYLNALIPSKQRATVLSFDSLLGSTGGIITQPSLGKVADVYSYSISFAGAAIFQLVALPFLIMAKREKSKVDKII